MPPSRAKANVNRETEASRAKQEAMAMMMIADSIADAPTFDPVACRKISMMGKSVGVLSASLIFPIAKRSASRIPNARDPLMIIVRKTTLGMVVAASFTSSDL